MYTLVWLLNIEPLSFREVEFNGESSNKVSNISSSSMAVVSSATAPLTTVDWLVLAKLLESAVLLFDFGGSLCVMDSSAYSTSFSPDKISSGSASLSSKELASSKDICISAVFSLRMFLLVSLSSFRSEAKSSSCYEQYFCKIM